MIAAMERDLHLGSAQAKALVDRELAAGRTERDLRAALGTRFGGAWLTAGAATLVVAVTDPALADRVRAAGAEPKVVKHSERDLATIKSTLDKAPRPPSGAVSGWYVDTVTNTVVVRAHPDAVAAAGEFVKAGGADPGVVRVSVSADTPRTVERAPLGIYGGDRFTVPEGYCSLGFTVGNYVQHLNGWITAGHCGRTGDAATMGYGATGTFRGSVFPGNDYAWVSHDNYDFDYGPFGMPAVYNYQSDDGVRVEGLQEAPVGASICRSGFTSGWRCGTIQAKNETVNYLEGTVVGLTRTSACAEPGDSGGPYMSGGQAQGVTSGGSGNCTFGGTTFFQPLNPILRAYQLKLMSVNGALDPPA
ncbi:serine protease [Amycolatopsis vastitatis]|uniref:Serine protease n=2 Tax=Amycolatopsis vastitatis TaxID=1905142 RepID=A0A229SVM8_9PSEU|nr:serine protease [Amycolatopsis vastitatis]